MRGMQLIWADIETPEIVAPQLFKIVIKSRLDYLNVQSVIPLVTSLEYNIDQFTIRLTRFVKQMFPVLIYMIVKELAERVRMRSLESVIGIHLETLRNNYPDHFGCVLILLSKITLYRDNQLSLPTVKFNFNI